MFEVHIEQGHKYGAKVVLRGEAGMSELGVQPGDVSSSWSPSRTRPSCASQRPRPGQARAGAAGCHCRGCLVPCRMACFRAGQCAALNKAAAVPCLGRCAGIAVPDVCEVL